MQGLQEDDNKSVEENENISSRNCSRNRNNAPIEWSGHQCIIAEEDLKEAFDQSKVKSSSTPSNLSEKLMLDNGLMIEATVKNEKFLTNIRLSKNPIVMTTNAGYKKMGLNGDLAGIGVAKYDADQLANILGFLHMADKYCIQYNNAYEDAFKMHLPDKIVKFTRDGRLYTYKPTKEFLEWVEDQKRNNKERDDKISNESDAYNGLDFVMTKKGNRDGYTDRQYERAKRAWKLYINTGGGGLRTSSATYGRI